MDAVAGCVSELTRASNDVITHLGNGILLTACEGRSALNKDALHTRLEETAVHDTLRAHDLTLRVILGEENTVAQGSASDILFMVSRAIEGTERQEEELSGWVNFREWLSFSKSTGRERARIDQSAYEQILDDFISEGELTGSRRAAVCTVWTCAPFFGFRTSPSRSRTGLAQAPRPRGPAPPARHH
jgi:hypothetical protein